ncbi:MAG: transketolase, partial [Candidatus Thermoplasmatota archaeon]|nr:transketolase [Candidatus Thermoplasmatota archaeon]
MEELEVSVQSLEDTAKNCRRSIVNMIHKAGAGHPGGSLSAIDIIVGLYGTQLRVDSQNPDSEDRDRFI